METFEGNVEDFQGAGNQSFSSPADVKLRVRFFKKAAQDMEATQKEGRPIFMEVEYVQIMVAGDRDTVNVRPATWVDKQRFAKQYEDWKTKNSSEQLVGTPLEAWGVLSLAQIEEFRYFGVRTVEHIADLRDDLSQKIMGAQALKQRAGLFIQAGKEAAPMMKMQEELAKRDNDIDTLKKALAEQGAALQALQAVKKAA